MINSDLISNSSVVQYSKERGAMHVLLSTTIRIKFWGETLHSDCVLGSEHFQNMGERPKLCTRYSQRTVWQYSNMHWGFQHNMLCTTFNSQMQVFYCATETHCKESCVCVFQPPLPPLYSYTLSQKPLYQPYSSSFPRRPGLLKQKRTVATLLSFDASNKQSLFKWEL